MKLPIFVVAMMLAVASTVEAKVYRWLDASGNVVYSQSPPPDAGKVDELDLPGNEEGPGNDRRQGGNVPEKEKTGDTGTSGQIGKPLDPETRKQYCEKAKKNLELLRSADEDSVFITEKQEMVHFTAEEKARRMKRAEEAAAAYCSKTVEAE